MKKTQTLEQFLEGVPSGTPIYKLVAKDECGHIGVELHVLVNHYTEEMFVVSEKLYKPKMEDVFKLSNKKRANEA